jgi:nucleotide sugar dehydrogenase
MFHHICIIGLGEVGFPTADYILKKNLNVSGYDISSKAVKNAKDNQVQSYLDFSEIPTDIDVFIVCVNTGLTADNEADMSAVWSVCELIKKRKPKLVSIESTLIPGTSRAIYNQLLSTQISLVHVPHRFWPSNPQQYGVNQNRVIGAIDTTSMELGYSFYSTQLGIPLTKTETIEAAEMTKITENAYRYVSIAFAEEIYLICNELGINFEDVRNAANSKWNTQIMEPRNGIGGPCLPKDTQYVRNLVDTEYLIQGAMKTDQRFRDYSSK